MTSSRAYAVAGARTDEALARTPLARAVCVRVGTLNAPKLEAVRAAVAAYAPAVRVEGVAVDSGVPEQPVGYPEIVAGARNRARAARASGACDLAVGIEDGLVELRLEALGDEVINVGCAFVTDGARDSIGFSSGFAYPPGCVETALRDRTPIGGTFDRLFGERATDAFDAAPSDRPSGLTIGNVGKLTLGVLPRSDYARHAVLCALVRFLHPALYAPETRG